MIRPIFLFSLPRSGSTLLQRIVAAHSQVHTVSEPWLLLPQFYAQRQRGTVAEYSHTAAAFNIRKFCDELPHGIDDYREALRVFALDLYSRCCPPGKTYFLDKTPRYALIVDDLLATFPEGRFIFLWRNPLAVIGSNFEMFGHFPMSIYTNHIDLREGLGRLICASRAQESRVLVVQYEDLLIDPEACWRKLTDYLELPYEPGPLETFAAVRLTGKSGDKTGVKRYRQLSREPLEKWRGTLSNPLRKAWTRRYLLWLGKERAAVMGYDLESLLADLGSIRPGFRNIMQDARRLTMGRLAVAFKQQVFHLRRLKFGVAWKKQKTKIRKSY